MTKLHILLLSLFACGSISAQVIINEYSASNLKGIVDSFGKTEDWVELYNSGDDTVDISGWHLSDKEDNTTRWAFPEGTQINSNGYLTVFCSSKDGLYNNEYHTSFKLTQTKGNDILLLADRDGTIMDMQVLKITLTEHSNCRSMDGSSDWLVCPEPSFGTSNNNSDKVKGYTTSPEISLTAGFYPSAQTVTISNNEENAVLRYTLDGSNPTVASPIYNTTISVSETTVIKALAFSNDPDILPGKISFSTYFIGEEYSLPVFSVAADRVTNLANGLGALLPIGSLEYFKDGELVATSFGDLNRHGQDSWVLPHRSIDWISRDEMGYSAAVQAPLFSDTNRDEFQRFMFRNSGDDNYPAIDDEDHEGSTHIRDEYVQQLAYEGDLRLDTRTVERVVLFLNGEYWGVYGMREKVVDHDFTKEYYDQDKENLQYLSTWGDTDMEYGGRPALDAWLDLRDFILNNDMAAAENYTLVDDSLDLVSLIDYFVMNQAAVASDWLNYNTGWWRGLNPEGTHKKWGYILWDLDATFDYYINYTGVPNTDPDASLCDIYPISDAIDDFFNGFESPCDFLGGNNSPYDDSDALLLSIVEAVPSCCTIWDDTCQGYYDDPSTIPEVSVSNCPSLLNGTSPYTADDSIFVQVVEADSYCCGDWDDICQSIYNDFSSGGSTDSLDCAVFSDGMSPYTADNEIAQEVIFFESSCCDEWTGECQSIYDEIEEEINNEGPDISDCPVIINGTTPYDIDDPKLPVVIAINPSCCAVWGVSCDNDYALLGGDEFSAPDDPLTTHVPGNIGQHEKILLKLFEESADFKQLYYSRYADLMNTVFSCENMNELLERMIADIEPEMPRQIARWGGTMVEWQSNLDDLRSFINERCAYLNDEALACHGEVSGQYNLTLITEPIGVGNISINTLKIKDFPWSGEYFGNMDNKLSATVKNSLSSLYQFSHWESKIANQISPSVESDNAIFRMSTADTIVAVYALIDGEVANEDLVINEFMASNDTAVSDADGEFDDWIELYNKGTNDIDLSGYFLSDNAENRTKYSLPSETILAADEYLIVWADEDDDQDGLHANFKLSKSGETILLSNSDTLLIDQISYTDQITDRTMARKPNGTGEFVDSSPTFGINNESTTRTDDGPILRNLLSVFPNPSSHRINLKLSDESEAIDNIKLVNALGKVVIAEANNGKKRATLDVKHLAAGLYHIVVNNKYTVKVVIQ